MSDPEVAEIRRRDPVLDNKLRHALFRNRINIIRNSNAIRNGSRQGYERILRRQTGNLDSVIESFFSKTDEFESDRGKPSLLCKFMPKEHAVKSIFDSTSRYSSVGYYRQNNDMFECTIPIEPESCPQEQFASVMSRIVEAVLEERGMDIGSTWDKIQSLIERDYFVGCFTDGKSPDHMWREYARGDGVCIWFEPDYSKIHRILYQDYLASADELRVGYRQMFSRIGTEEQDSFWQDLGDLTRDVIDLAIMSFYTKK